MLGEMMNRRNRFLTKDEVTLMADKYHQFKTQDKKYEDEPGFVKVATLKEIAENDFVLTPGRYVGFAEAEEDATDAADGQRHRPWRGSDAREALVSYPGQRHQGRREPMRVGNGEKGQTDGVPRVWTRSDDDRRVWGAWPLAPEGWCGGLLTAEPSILGRGVRPSPGTWVLHVPGRPAETPPQGRRPMRQLQVLGTGGCQWKMAAPGGRGQRTRGT